ncbi:hypothetical protein T4C_6333, partial [Trichinella pseudospiralis]
LLNEQKSSHSKTCLREFTCKFFIVALTRKNLCLLSLLNSSHSRTCLPENVCKFIFHCYVHSYLALLICILKKSEYKIYMKTVMASAL